jgi:hypothetical protein
MRYVAYLFYRYYSSGPTKDIAYYSTLFALSLLFFIHLCQVLLIFGWTNIIPRGRKTEITTWLKMGLFLIPIFTLFKVMIKEKTLSKLTYDEKIINKGYYFLFFYIIISMTILVLLILYKKGKI